MSADPVPLGQLTDLLGIDRSSVFRLANTLRRRGFLTNPIGGRDYILGPSIWRLSRKYGRSSVLTTFCHQHVKMLALKTGETAHLAVREGDKALFIDHHTSSSQMIVVSGQTGESVPLYCTAHGKALLADCGLEDLKSIFGRARFEAYTPQTITSIKELAKACTKIKAQGFAVDDGEMIEGVRCLAAPIRDQDGAVVASIGISAPLARFPQARNRIFARQVCDVAKQISIGLSAEAPT